MFPNKHWLGKESETTAFILLDVASPTLQQCSPQKSCWGSVGLQSGLIPVALLGEASPPPVGCWGLGLTPLGAICCIFTGFCQDFADRGVFPTASSLDVRIFVKSRVCWCLEGPPYPLLWTAFKMQNTVPYLKEEGSKSKKKIANLEASCII